MQKDFSTTTQTKSGYPVRNLKWNSAAQCWVGQVWDSNWGPDGKWLSGIWTKTGKYLSNSNYDL